VEAVELGQDEGVVAVLTGVGEESGSRRGRERGRPPWAQWAAAGERSAVDPTEQELLEEDEQARQLGHWMKIQRQRSVV
jgi:hypothetical protein